MATEMDQPPDASYHVASFAAKTLSVGIDDPPEVLLVVDVVHEEAHIDMKMQARFSRAKFTEFVQLMNHVARQEGLL